MNYRQIARDHLKAAGDELRSSNNQRLKYAALELRMAMEAITYDRALAYGNEFPPSEYETWQPKKVLMVLLEIDASSDMNNSISVGLQNESNGIPETMIFLGEEKVFNLRMLKNNYDALSSYLHIISMKQSRKGKSHDFSKLKKRCEEIYAQLDQALKSSIFNSTLGNFSSLACMECNNPIRKRIPSIFVNPILVKCFNCRSTYTLTNSEQGEVIWHLNQQAIKCGNPDCQKERKLLDYEVTVGRGWFCSDCNGKNTISLCVRYDKETNKE